RRARCRGCGRRGAISASGFIVRSPRRPRRRGGSPRWGATIRRCRAVSARGGVHPPVPVELVERAFARVEGGADVVLGPAEDGGYYLIALRASAVAPRLFAEIAWSTGEVLPATLARCRELGLAVELLPVAADVDTPDDLHRLAARMAGEDDLGCPRTRSLLASLGFLPSQIQNPKSKISAAGGAA